MLLSLKMFFCISMGFIVAWTPYTVVSFLYIFHKEDTYMAPAGFVFPALFAKSSHVYNPLIYFYFNKAFRQELRSLLRCLLPIRASNRIGVLPAAVSHVPVPLGIQIQLQEQKEVRGRRMGGSGGGSWGGSGGVRGVIGLVKSQSRSGRSRKSSSSAGREGQAGVPGGPTCPCFVPKIRVAPLVLGPGTVREFLPIST